MFFYNDFDMQRHGLADTFKEIYYPRLFIKKKKKTTFTTWFPFLLLICVLIEIYYY